ncbi:transcription elongation factor [Gonapodya prolifera JEL478]|uniref:Transcription elongation factor n=1 Tax=Gonapodya prolifera (strain JEL478) TaxID=1344416 RepID=A0A139A535_GONPJ|nr:transcription elongation factor [Gonapodya prolifera JEL478]|eukprot:KXS11900.1 transcription elongation factor [Gonapodya prolifera JEL478]
MSSKARTLSDSSFSSSSERPIALSVDTSATVSNPATLSSISGTPIERTPSEISATLIERTPAQDGVRLDNTGSSARDKCTEMMYKALSLVGWANPEHLVSLSSSLERLTWKTYGPEDAKYKARIRSLYLNLKDRNNPGFRERVLAGELSLERLNTMSTDDMASPELKQQVQALQKQALNDAQVAKDSQAETDQFKCGKCGYRKTKYFQKQTRSADEPMTTFVTCLHCK